MHYLNPNRKSAHVVLFYRNFMSMPGGYCHVGLGNNGIHTVRVLRKHGIRADLYGVREPADIRKILTEIGPATHVVIEAFWVSLPELQSLMAEFPNSHFIVRSHSQISFLQVEAGAIKNLRDLVTYQEGALNLTVAANNRKMCDFVEKTYLGRCLYLPNLYDLDRVHRRMPMVGHHHRTLRIGSFGALRLLKNHTAAAAAALLIAERKRCDLEFWISVNRKENNGSDGILQSLRNMFQGLPWAKLHEHPWEMWPDFRRSVAHMDLTIQASFTETFNITAADSVAEGVPCVTGPAIEWVPSSWQADVDTANDIARVGMALLADPLAAEEGLESLKHYSHTGAERWLRYLDENPTN